MPNLPKFPAWSLFRNFQPFKVVILLAIRQKLTILRYILQDFVTLQAWSPVTSFSACSAKAICYSYGFLFLSLFIDVQYNQWLWIHTVVVRSKLLRPAETIISSRKKKQDTNRASWKFLPEKEKLYRSLDLPLAASSRCWTKSSQFQPLFHR